jgi:hypothetical protein
VYRLGGDRNCPMCMSGQRERGEIVSVRSVDDSGNALPGANTEGPKRGWYNHRHTGNPRERDSHAKEPAGG